MPGTWTSGVKRLRASVTALVIGVLAVVVTPAVSWSATLTASQTVTLRAGHSSGTTVGAPSSPTTAAHLAGAVHAAPQGAPAATAGAAAGAVSGQAAGAASTDLSVESVSAPPAVVPWIVVALVLLVIAGAARAYGRSPQRAAIRDRRARS